MQPQASKPTGLKRLAIIGAIAVAAFTVLGTLGLFFNYIIEVRVQQKFYDASLTGVQQQLVQLKQNFVKRGGDISRLTNRTADLEAANRTLGLAVTDTKHKLKNSEDARVQSEKEANKTIATITSRANTAISKAVKAQKVSAQAAATWAGEASNWKQKAEESDKRRVVDVAEWKSKADATDKKLNELARGYAALSQAMLLQQKAFERNGIGFFTLSKNLRKQKIGEAIRLYREADAYGALPDSFRPVLAQLLDDYNN